MDLREAIIRTVCYFDIFDFPLTRREAGDRMYGAVAAAAEVDRGIASLIEARVIETDGEYIFLRGRSGLPAVRAERKVFSERKWRRARKWARIFAAFPGVELAGVGNTLAYDNARDGSDIDLFIVTAPKAIWRTRFFCAALAAVLDLRPKNGNNRDKLCLSFFVTTEALNMQALALGANDVYMHYWTRQMRPLAGKQRTADLFFSKNHETSPREKIGRSVVLRLLCAPLGLLPGSFMRGWQRRHFPKAIVDAEAEHNGSVVISDSILKFHVSDRRADIYERWQKRVESILNESRQDHRTT